ncbi:hypothetical protein ACHAPT_002301 [Fusarium lateritium]
MIRRKPAANLLSSRTAGESSQYEQPDTIREQVLQKIKEDLESRRTMFDIREKRKNELQSCLWDPKSKHKTVLHWIVNHADAVNKDIEEAKIMITLVMKDNEDLICEHDQRDETALHQALSSNKPIIQDLARCMYDSRNSSSNPSTIQKAIARTNGRGENCLHLAIAANHDTALELIPIANDEAFLQRRTSKDESKTAARDGNTPLHDAVDYGRFVFKQPVCSKKTADGEMCCRCTEADRRNWELPERACNLVAWLVDKCDKALKVKNAKDESPYLYHLRTQRNYPKESSKPATSGECGEELNTEAATFIERYLTESAFAIGSYGDACASYTSYKEVIPMGTSVMSHVDLCVGPMNVDPTVSPPPQPGGASAIVQKGQEGSDASSKHDKLRRWEKDMRSLTNVFEMLKDRGVKRILKVTVRDNERRPCSDSVIQRCLAGFDVRYLDWNKRDLSIDVVHAACPNIAELTLYSSGRRAVLSGWNSSAGLWGLKLLTCLNIHAERVSMQSLKAYIQDEPTFNSQIQGLEEYEDFGQSIKNFKDSLQQHMILTRSELRLHYEMYQLLPETTRYKEAKTGDDEETESYEQQSGDEGNPEEVPTSSVEGFVEDPDSLMKELRCKLRRITKERASLEKRYQTTALASTGMIIHPDAEAFDENGVDSIDGEPDAESTQGSRMECRDPGFEESFPESKLFETGGHWPNYSYGAVNFAIQDTLEGPPMEHGGANKKPNNNSTSESQVQSAIYRNRWLEAVEKFVQKQVVPGNASDKDVIKVALIDDGVDVRQFGGEVVPPGWPPVKPTSNGKPWYHSEGGHGTSMAKMIIKMCPRVRLMVAKLEGKDPATSVDSAANAAAAVEWAIKQRVDIISMSWSLVRTNENRKGIDELDKQIQRAANEKILLYCAAADKGRYDDHVELYPRDSDTKVIRLVGSAKESGGESEFVHADRVDYLFPGEAIHELNGCQGSSAAAALAAGLAALILWCFQQSPSKPEARFTGMDSVFKRLKVKGSKWVNVTALLKVDGSATVEDVIEACKAYARQ